MIIGESEIYLWGGDEKSLGNKEPEESKPAEPVASV